MKGSRSRMRSGNAHLSEMTIKVPAPFAGISDLGFTAQYRDRSLSGQTLSDGAHVSANYVLNLVRPVVFAFLKDCAGVAHLRLSDVIEMRVSTEGAPNWD